MASVQHGTSFDESSLRQRIDCKVHQIKQITPTVKLFCLQAPPNTIYRFYPGQWIDLYLPRDIQNARYSNATKIPIGGYSMISNPDTCVQSGIIEFAIKRTEIGHPVTNWVTNEAKEGDIVPIDGPQGKFFFTKEAFPSVKNIILIGGGIGATPLFSMFRYIANSEECKDLRLLVFYSASSQEELLFLDEFAKVHKDNNISKLPNQSRVHVILRTTKKQPQLQTEFTNFLQQGRIDKTTVQDGLCSFFGLDSSKLAGEQLHETSTRFFLSGPTKMLDEVPVVLEKELHVNRSIILYEKW